MEASPKGPLVYETWKAISVRGETASGSYEVRLYTDAPIEEFYQREYGPYLFIHTGHPEVEGPQCVPALVLLMPDISNSIAGLYMTSNLVCHEPWEQETSDRPAVAPPDIQSDMNRYHAGVLHDEVAALTSLALGIRLKASDSVRRFDQYTGEKGRPTYRHDLSKPSYSRKFSNYVIPDAVTPRDFAPELFRLSLPH